MDSKEAVEFIEKELIEYVSSDRKTLVPSDREALRVIKKDLARLNKLEKAVAIAIKYKMINKDNFDYDFEEKETFYKDRFIKDADANIIFEVFELDE